MGDLKARGLGNESEVITGDLRARGVGTESEGVPEDSAFPDRRIFVYRN